VNSSLFGRGERCLLESLTTDGFAELELPGDLYRQALMLAERFYRIPLAARMAIGAFTTRGVLGYYPSEAEALEFVHQGGVSVPLFSGARARGYSSFDFIGNPKVVGSAALLKENLWPAFDVTFCDEACATYAAIGAFTRDLAAGILTTVGDARSSRHEPFSSDCCSLMRLLQYQEAPTAGYSKPHTDYEFITLNIASGPGLEIRRNDRGWQRLRCGEGKAVILPGDALEMISGGRIVSTLHRVSYGDSPRTAVVFFQGMPLKYKVKSAIADYSPRTFGDHLLAMLIRGAAHLKDDIGELEKSLGVSIPDSNPFRRNKG